MSIEGERFCITLPNDTRRSETQWSVKMRPDDDPAMPLDDYCPEDGRTRQRFGRLAVLVILVVAIVAFGAYAVIGYLTVSNA